MKPAIALSLLLSFAAAAQPRGEEHHIRGLRVGPPPAPRFERRPPRPTYRHVWVPGYWAPRGGNTVWIEGRWITPPASNYVWDPAHWEQEPDGQWVFYEGHWDNTAEPGPAEVYQAPPPPIEDEGVNEPPPAPIEEVQPAMPFAGAIWIPGFWRLNAGRYVWVAGRWSARPGGMVWEPHRYIRGRDGRWMAEPGHWRR